MTKGYIFSDDEAKRVASAAHANEGRPPYQLPPRPRPIRAGGGGGSGGNGLIKFSVVSASNAIGQGVIGCNFVQATVTYVGCGNSGGVAVGDEVTIFDPDYCYFNIPINLLTNLKGTAQKFDNPFDAYDDAAAEDCQYGLLAQGDCVWMVTSLCCAEEYPF